MCGREVAVGFDAREQRTKILVARFDFAEFDPERPDACGEMLQLELGARARRFRARKQGDVRRHLRAAAVFVHHAHHFLNSFECVAGRPQPDRGTDDFAGVDVSHQKFSLTSRRYSTPCMHEKKYVLIRTREKSYATKNGGCKLFTPRKPFRRKA